MRMIIEKRRKKNQNKISTTTKAFINKNIHHLLTEKTEPILCPLLLLLKIFQEKKKTNIKNWLCFHYISISFYSQFFKKQEQKKTFELRNYHPPLKSILFLKNKTPPTKQKIALCTTQSLHTITYTTHLIDSNF